MYRIRFIIYFFLLFVVRTMSEESMPTRNFTPELYNGETQNWTICQAEDNVVYIANNKGLLEFNGANWKLYPSPNHTILRSVAVKEKRVYTGCYMDDYSGDMHPVIPVICTQFGG